MTHAFTLAAEQPWLILPAALETLLAVADRQGDPEALEARLGRPLDNARRVTLRDGVAVVPVTGPIMRYANLFTRISGATSTQQLATDIQTALDDPKVRAIVLNIDSPGGQASGINELADLIYAARRQKPVKAYIGGTGASAAYWLASAASEVVVDDTAVVGSIGVVVEVAVEPAAKEGSPQRYTLVSRNAPNKRPDLATEDGRAKIVEMIDALGEVFVSKVARNLNVSAENVPAMGDSGGVRIGAAAVAAGLAHRLGSLETLIAELAQPPRKPAMTTVVRTTAELKAALAAGTDPALIQIAEPATVDTEALKADAARQAAETERTRILAIQAMSRPGFEKDIRQAIDSGQSPEATALALLKAVDDRGITLDGIRHDATATHASHPPKDPAATRPINPNSIWAARKRASPA